MQILKCFLITVLVIGSHTTWTMEDNNSKLERYRKSMANKYPDNLEAQYDHTLRQLEESYKQRDLLVTEYENLKKKLDEQAEFYEGMVARLEKQAKKDDKMITLLSRIINQQLSDTSPKKVYHNQENFDQTESPKRIESQQRKSF